MAPDGGPRAPAAAAAAAAAAAGDAPAPAPAPAPEPAPAPARLWADLCLGAPALVWARALEPDARLVTAVWAQRDVVSGKTRSFAVDYARLGPAPADPHAAFQPVELTPAVAAAAQFCSPSGRRAVRFVPDAGGAGGGGGGGDGALRAEPGTGGAGGGIVVEVWSCASLRGGADCEAGPGLEASWRVPAKTHGPAFADEWFGGVAWSPDENLFIYVADRPPAACAGSGNGNDATEPALDHDQRRSRTTSSTSNSDYRDADRKPDVESWIDALRSKFDQSARDPLGEAYVNRKYPALFLADVRKLSTRPLCTGDRHDPGSEKNDLFGDPQWSPDGRWVAVTRRPTPLTEPSLEKDGISDSPYDLGVRYCYNRYSSIELFPAPANLDDAPFVLDRMVPVTNHSDLNEFCCSSPRFSPDSRCLIYISAPRKHVGRTDSLAQPHNTAKVLRACVLEAQTGSNEPEISGPVTVVDIVRSASRAEFPGLHLHSLPQRPWLGESKTVILSSQWGSDLCALLVHIDEQVSNAEQSVVRPVPPTDVKRLMIAAVDGIVQSASVLDVCAHGAIVSTSSPVHAPRLGILKVTEGSCDLQYVSKLSKRAESLTSVASPFYCADLMLDPETNLESIDASMPAHEFVKGSDESKRYEVTLIIPRLAVADMVRVPLIVIGHGGPHSSCINSYTQSGAAFLASGMALLYVNYRGSVGFGQDLLESLPGRAGTQDVAEVAQAAQWALQKAAPSLLDKERVGYVGGSHGGFLGAHLSVLANTPIKRTALRNPVVNIASMVHVSDIPEWAFCEAGIAPLSPVTGLALTADPSALEKMWRVSPVARVKKAGQEPGPTLLFVGGSDKRVPPEQSIEWMRLITEAFGPGIVTMRWYKGSGHAIDEVPNGDDVWVHTLEFLMEL